VTLGDLEKRDPQRRLKALQALTKGPWTPQDLAQAWSVNQSTSYRLLARLVKQGLASCEGGKPTYRGNYMITDQGREKIVWLASRAKMERQVEELGDILKLPLCKHCRALIEKSR